MFLTSAVLGLLISQGANAYTPPLNITIPDGGKLPILETPKLAHQRVFKILSYNVQGLPGFLAPDKGRFAEIGRILKERRKNGTAPDVVALQEAFKSGVDQIVKGSGYKYVVYGPQGSTFEMNSGLILLTDHELIAKGKHQYSECYSHDCFANKGFHMVRIRMKDTPFEVDVYNTHMNSNLDLDFWSDAEKPKEIRLWQVSEIHQRMSEWTGYRRAVFFVGDVNMRPHEEAFPYLMSDQKLKNAEVAFKSNEEAQRHYKASVDHQFYRAQTRPPMRIRPTAFIKNFKQLFNGRKLSDHTGLEIHYKIQW